MSRDIKFRAWDSLCPYMSNPFSLYDIQNKKISFTMDVKIMQYTGLKDKNGKEIYEGDILVRILPNGDIGRKIICEDIRDVFMTNNIADDPHLIIGNIYENPELLK